MLNQFLSVHIAVEDKYLVQTSDEINSYATRKWRIARSKGLIHTTDYSHCPKNNLNLRIEAEPVTLLDHPHCPKNNLNVYIKSKPVTAEVDATVHLTGESDSAVDIRPRSWNLRCDMASKQKFSLRGNNTVYTFITFFWLILTKFFASVCLFLNECHMLNPI